MACEFYVADDGSIHRYQSTDNNITGSHANTYAPKPGTEHIQSEMAGRQIHQVSEERIMWFWIISIIMAILIAVGVIEGFGAELFGDDGGFEAIIGPFVVFVGALAGSILYVSAK